MTTRCFFIIVSSLVLLFSCVKTGEPGKESEDAGAEYISGEHPVFTASTESTSQMKAGLDGYDVVWAAGDEISISDNKGHSAIYRAASGGQSVSFSYYSGDALSTGADVIYTAWYPAACASGYIPGAQTYVQEGIHDIPMKAVSESGSTDLGFMNISGIIKVVLQGAYDNICAVVVAAEKPLTGAFNTNLSPGDAATVRGTGSAQITIPSGDGRDISSGKEYFFSAATGTYKSLWVGVLNSDGELAYYSGSSIVVSRSRITTLGPISVASMGNTETVNLSASATANCYLTDLKRDYRFRANVKGNSNQAISPVSADILWSEGVSGGHFSVIRPVIYYNGYIWFRKDRQDEAYRSGNALVAARNASGEILWSWHIWASSALSTHTWTGGGQMMDRNLGAVSASVGDSNAMGLLYQWGRKDPFPVSRGEGFPAAISTDSSVGTVAYTTANPTQWIYGTEDTCYDWSFSVQDGTAWNNSGSKGLHDPCPPGWRIPDGGGHGITAKARGATPVSLSGFWNVSFGTGSSFFGKNSDQTSWWKGSSSGMKVPASVSGSDSWFPATGYFAPESGDLVGQGTEGGVWTRTCEPVMSSIHASAFFLSFGSGRVCPAAFSGRAAGRSVRCVKQ